MAVQHGIIKTTVYSTLLTLSILSILYFGRIGMSQLHSASPSQGPAAAKIRGMRGLMTYVTGKKPVLNKTAGPAECAKYG